MLTGPIFSREVLTAPRQMKHFLLRSGYVAALFVLMYTIQQSTIGFQDIRNVGDLSRFGSLVFQVFALVQLALVMFFALLFSAGTVSQEKDRKTLILLMMTDLRDRELVFGKLATGLLNVGILIAVSAPVFCLLYLLGGVSLAQILWLFPLCGASALAAGAWGNFVAFWRDKTFQTLAVSVLGVVIFIGLIEALIGALDHPQVTHWVGLFNPFRALWELLSPLQAEQTGPSVPVSSLQSVTSLTLLAVALSSVTTVRLRHWYPPRIEIVHATAAGESQPSRLQSRSIWDNPIIWREIRTRAYGHRVALIKLAFVGVAFFTVFWLSNNEAQHGPMLGMLSPTTVVFVGLSLISLMIVNALAVTALTNERDGKTLELLLVTDITAREFMFGKLGGILYNTKEVILVPLLVLAFASWSHLVTGITLEYGVYLFLGFAALVMFSAVLGLHSGLSYENSRAAIINSLGTVFFLFIGILIFMVLLVEARSSFQLQFQSFIVFIVAGSIGLWASISHKNPSPALMIAAGLLPFLTFYAITLYLMNGSLGVCFWIVLAYGFATIAMLIPAVSDFDVALGRTTIDHG
ncbi:MAG: ABC transporter permease [Planctomycetaceae bacterium]